MWWFTSRHAKTLAVFVLAISLVGVLGISQSRPEPSNRTTLLIDTISQPETLDPAWSFFTADSAIIEQMYEHLVDYRLGSTDEFVPELAVEVPTVENGGISADGLTYAFTLKSGIQFWDGSLLTCADVEYSMERVLAMDRDGGPSLILLDPLLGISTTRDDDGNLIQTVTINGQQKSLAQAIDEAVECRGNQVVFQLAHPFPPFLQLMAHSSTGSIYSKAFAIANGAADNANPQAFLEATNNPRDASLTAFFNKAMGTGPFRLQVWDQVSQQVIVRRFEGYRDGPATLENVIWSNVPEFSTRLLRLSRGDADISYLSTRTQTQQLKDQRPAGVRLIEGLPGLVVETIHLAQFVQQVDIGGNQFVGSGRCDGFGIPANFFQDIHVRKAFNYAFDQATFIQDVLLGAGRPGITPIPPGIPFFNPNQPGYTFNLDLAEQELKQARCTGSNQSVWETGFKLTIVFNEGNARRQNAALFLENALERLNARRPGLPRFDIEVLGEPGPVVLNQVFGQELLPVFIFGWSPDFIDPDNYIRQWMHTAGAYSGSTGVKFVAKSAEWDRLIDEAISITDEARREQIYLQLQQDFVDFALAVMMPYRTLDNVERSWVNGNYYNPAEGDPQEPPNVYVLSKRADGQPNLEELEPYGPTIIEF
jgi:peptide/nickel transport system substrate-binding protein